MRRVAIAGAVVAALLLATGARAGEPIEPVDFSKLLPFLPENVDGFVADKPQGSTSSAMGFKLTEVSRVYHKGEEDTEETVTLKITDGAGNQFFEAAHAAAREFNTENAEGYEKGLRLDGYPAIERYTQESRDGSLTVFIASRYLIEIDIDGLNSDQMRVWWKRIDAKRLANLKDS